MLCPLLGDYLGGEAYWAGGLHLYTPLPFRPGQGGFGELFRTHFFLNAGNLCNLNYGKTRWPLWPIHGPQVGAFVLGFIVATCRDGALPLKPPTTPDTVLRMKLVNETQVKNRHWVLPCKGPPT